MSEWTKLLRLLVQADKEAKVTAVTSFGTNTKFTSHLTSGNTRKRLLVSNASDAASGECYIGFDANISPSGESVPVPKMISGENRFGVPIADTDNIELYHCCDSGEFGDLRFEEYA